MHKLFQGIKTLPPFSLVNWPPSGTKVIRHKKREQTSDQVLVAEFSSATMSLSLSLSEVSVRLGHNPSDAHSLIRPLLRNERTPTTKERKLMSSIIESVKKRQTP